MIVPYPLIRPLIGVAVVTAVAVGGLLYVKHIEHRGVQRGRIEATVEFDKLNRQAREEADQREAARRVAMEKSRARDVAQAKANAAAADAARGELAGLRLNLAAADAAGGNAAGTGPGADAAATARELLAACADRYVEVAGTADQLSSQVSGLQGYVRAVLRTDQIEGGCLGAAECPRAGAVVSLVSQAAAEPSGGIQPSAAPPQGEGL